MSKKNVHVTHVGKMYLFVVCISHQVQRIHVEGNQLVHLAEGNWYMFLNAKTVAVGNWSKLYSPILTTVTKSLNQVSVQIFLTSGNRSKFKPHESHILLFVTPTPKVLFSMTVEVLEDDLFPSSGRVKWNPKKCPALNWKSPKVLGVSSCTTRHGAVYHGAYKTYTFSYILYIHTIITSLNDA